MTICPAEFEIGPTMRLYIYTLHVTFWRVSDFQKIFPKAKDVIAQAELVKDDIVVYNRKIVQLNAELETIPERCPFEVSVMCQMISRNKLQAENHTYLVDIMLFENQQQYEV